MATGPLMAIGAVDMLIPPSALTVLLGSLDAGSLQQLERRCTWHRWHVGEQIIEMIQAHRDVGKEEARERALRRGRRGAAE